MTRDEIITRIESYGVYFDADEYSLEELKQMLRKEVAYYEKAQNSV